MNELFYQKLYEYQAAKIAALEQTLETSKQLAGAGECVSYFKKPHYHGRLNERILATYQAAGRYLATHLGIYVSGFLNVFNHKTNVDLNHCLWT